MLVADDPRNIEMTREYIRSGFNVVERESHEVDIRGNPKMFRNSMIGIVESGMAGAPTWGIPTRCYGAGEGGRGAKKGRTIPDKKRRTGSGSHSRILPSRSSIRTATCVIPGFYNPQSYWQHESIGKTDAEIVGAKKAANLLNSNGEFSNRDVVAAGSSDSA